MIIVHISGGLGNQMFQYAAGFAQAQRLGVALKLDVSSYKTQDNARTYLLKKYTISAKTLSYFSRFIYKVKIYLKHTVAFPRTSSIYGEKSNRYDKAIQSIPDNTYLLGHWQSEKYFSQSKDGIKKQFTYLERLSNQAIKWAKKIRQTNNAVSVHIRRGDYVSNPVAAEVLGTLPVEYYQKAIASIEKRVKGPKYFFFSDDIEWVKQNIQLKHPAYYVSTNSACEDLELMKLCKHHIIANSSFSWWGAWLGTDSRSITVAPKKWFRSTKYSARDLIPQTWLQI